jgi:hypothetical protein
MPPKKCGFRPASTNGKANAEFIPKYGQDWLYYRLRHPDTPETTRDKIAMRLLKTEKPDLEAVAIAHTEGGIGTRLDRARERRDEIERARAEGRLEEFARKPKVIEVEPRRF